MSRGREPIGGVLGMGRDVAWTVLGLVVSAIGSLLAVGYALRRVGTFDFGAFTLANSVVALLVVVDFGLGTSVIHAVARQAVALTDDGRDSARADAETSHSVLVALGVLVCLGGLAFAYIVPVIIDVPRSRWADVVTMSVLVGLATGLAVATSALPGAVRGVRGFRAVSLATCAGAGCRLLFLVALIGRLGLVALGVAQVASVIAERAILAAWTRRHLQWFRLRPRRFDRAAVGRTAWVALPLIILAIDTQVVAASDAVVIGSVTGAAAVGIYRVGSIAPGQLIQSLFRTSAVSFPGLVGIEEARQIDIARFVTRLWSYLAGVGFTLLALFRRETVVALLGRRNATAELVVVLLSITFAVDAVPHAMVLLLIARGRQRLLAALAPVELVLNLILTVLLVQRWGPAGAAWAAVTSFLLLDLVLFPLVARSEFTPSAVAILTEGLGALALGSITCLAATSILWTTMRPSFARAGVGAVAGCAAGVGVGLVALGASGRDSLRATFRRV